MPRPRVQDSLGLIAATQDRAISNGFFDDLPTSAYPPLIRPRMGAFSNEVTMIAPLSSAHRVRGTLVCAALLVPCAFLITHCASPKPAQPPANPSSAPSPARELSQHLPDHFPYTVAVRPDRFDDLNTALNPALRAFVANMPEGTTLFDLGLAYLFGNVAQRPELRGIDPKRPILLGLLSVPDPTPFQLSVFGNILDPKEAPLFLHNRAVLPSKDSKALMSSIQAWMASLKIPKADVNFPDGSMLFGRDGVEVFIQPKNDIILVDVALRPASKISLKAKAAFLEYAKNLKSSPWEITSPARAHLFSDHNEAITAYVDFNNFSTLFAAQTTLEIKEFTGSTPQAFRKIFPYAARTTLNIADLMNPADRTYRDMSIGLHGSKTLDVTLVQSLSPEAAQAYAQSESLKTPRIQHVGTKPLASLRVGRSWNTLLSALSRPDWTQTESFEFLSSYLNSNSVTLKTYALLASTVDTFGHLTRIAQIDQKTLPSALPDGITLIVGDLGSESIGVVQPRGKLALQLPKGADKASYTSLFETLNAPLSALDFQGSMTAWKPSGSGHRAEFVLGNPEHKIPGVFKTFEPNRDESNFELLVHWPRIADRVAPSSPEVAKALRSLGVFTAQDRVRDDALITTARLSLGSEDSNEHTTPKLPTWTSPNSSKTPNANCTHSVTRLLFEANLSLSEAKTAEELRSTIQTYDNSLPKALECYTKDETLRAHKDTVWSGWLLYTSQLSMLRDDMPIPKQRLEKACQAERKAACDILTSFAPN